MSQEVVIQIRLTLPDGATYRVLTVPEPEGSVLNDPLPPEPNRPTNGAPKPAPRPAQAWAEGQVHQEGHKPLRTNKRGLFCPTKLADDSWCQWHP